MRREISIAYRDGEDLWVVEKIGLRYALIWYDCGDQFPIELIRHWKRKPLIDLAKQLENIPGGWIWTAAWADGEFDTLEKAQRWTQEALTQI